MGVCRELYKKKNDRDISRTHCTLITVRLLQEPTFVDSIMPSSYISINIHLCMMCPMIRREVHKRILFHPELVERIQDLPRGPVHLLYVVTIVTVSGTTFELFRCMQFRVNLKLRWMLLSVWIKVLSVQVQFHFPNRLTHNTLRLGDVFFVRG